MSGKRKNQGDDPGAAAKPNAPAAARAGPAGAASAPSDVEGALTAALAHHRAGRLDKAEALYRKILLTEPNQADALHLLGVLYAQSGDNPHAAGLIEQAISVNANNATFHFNLANVYKTLGRLPDAIAAYRRGLAIDPNHHEAHNNLGAALQEAGDLAEAAGSYQRALAIDPNNVEAHVNLGNLLQAQGKLDDAVSSYQRALAINPTDHEVHNHLGNALKDQGKLDEAVAAYRRALAINSDYDEAHFNLGNALKDQGKLDEAVAAYQRALAINPKFAAAHNNLGAVLHTQGKLEEALVACHRAIELRPNFAEAHYNLGSVLQEQGKLDEAAAAYHRALEFKPDFLQAEWGTLFALPILYNSEDEIDFYRARWEKGVKKLLSQLDLNTDVAIKEAEHALTSRTNFHLHYQGRNDLSLQKLYASLLHRIATALYPNLSEPLPKRQVAYGEKIRVGFISSYLYYYHSVYKTRSAWIKKLDKNRFEVHTFYTGKKLHGCAEDIRSHSDFFHHGIHSDRELIATIRSSELDVLVYPDIGMDPRMQLLAALRLAPVQCMGWAHPVTSGLPTIDYFLSNDLMEPDDADAHYSERLVRLPNLGICYSFPDIPEVARSEAHPSEEDGEIVYLCSQSLFKLLPQYDALYARIAAQVPNSRFWFIAHWSDFVTNQFKERLARAFSRQTLDADEHCIIHRRMKPRDFLALNQRADVALDSILWSGCNSTFEAIACGLPVVTLPGPMMRGRHSYGILRMIGVEDTIAWDEDDYVEIAVRLGKDRRWMERVANKVKDRSSRIFNDEAPIRALEDFFDRVCRAPD